MLYSEVELIQQVEARALVYLQGPKSTIENMMRGCWYSPPVSISSGSLRFRFIHANHQRNTSSGSWDLQSHWGRHNLLKSLKQQRNFTCLPFPNPNLPRHSRNFQQFSIIICKVKTLKPINASSTTLTIPHLNFQRMKTSNLVPSSPLFHSHLQLPRLASHSNETHSILSFKFNYISRKKIRILREKN